MLVVDPWHWLDRDGSLPTESMMRTRTLRVARLIEGGGPLPHGAVRQVLVECEKRRSRKPCRSLLLVAKTRDDLIHAFCPVCGADDTLISNWATTAWAKGPLPPIDMTPSPDGRGAGGAGSVH
jgi:hypothetical protein